MEIIFNTIGLENISDHGNLRKILRSSVRFGIKTILLSKGRAETYYPKVLKASLGAIFKLILVEKLTN